MLDIFNEYKAAIPDINPHYLKRYIRFVADFDRKTKSKGLESHHILIKSLFPQYNSGSRFPENRSVLSPREHYVAHKILYKAAKYNKKIAASWVVLSNFHKSSLSSREFDAARIANRDMQMGMVTVKNLITDEFERIPRETMQDHHVPSSLGLCRYWSETDNKVVSLTINDDIPDGYVRGVDPSRIFDYTKGMTWFYNPLNTDERTVCFESDAPKGWVAGNPSNDARGRVWVNDGTFEKMIFECDIESGWNVGRLPGSAFHQSRCNYHNPATREHGRFAKGQQPEGWVEGYGLHYYYDPVSKKSGLFTEDNFPAGWIKGNGKGYFYNPETQEYGTYVIGSEPNGWLPGQKPKKEIIFNNYRKVKPKIECPHCNRQIAVNVAKLWHFDNCKQKP